MPPRNVASQDVATQDAGNSLAVIGGDVSIEEAAPVIETAEPVETASPPVAVVEPGEEVSFAEAWVNSVRNKYNHTLIDTFLFECKRNGWTSDTPSGWANRFARWCEQ